MEVLNHEGHAGRYCLKKIVKHHHYWCFYSFAPVHLTLAVPLSHGELFVHHLLLQKEKEKTTSLWSTVALMVDPGWHTAVCTKASWALGQELLHLNLCAPVGCSRLHTHVYTDYAVLLPSSFFKEKKYTQILFVLKNIVFSWRASHVSLTTEHCV